MPHQVLSPIDTCVSFEDVIKFFFIKNGKDISDIFEF